MTLPWQREWSQPAYLLGWMRGWHLAEGGAVVDPSDGLAKLDYEAGQFLRGPAMVCVPAAPLRKNPLVRRKLVRANVAARVIGATATRMWTQTTYVTPRHVSCEQGRSTATRAADCGQGLLAAVNCATTHAEKAAMVTPCEGVKTAGSESRASRCSTEEGSSLQR